MFIIEVLPIHKSNINESLTYFSSKEVNEGSLVVIPFRNKKIKGVCVSCKLLKEQKSQIKNLSYNLKKIEKVKEENFLSKEFINFLDFASLYYCTSKSMILNSIIPDKFLDEIPKITKTKNQSDFRVDTVQDLKEERFTLYKSFIREEFAKKNSVFFCTSSIKESEEAKNILEKGIESKTFLVTSDTTEKELKQIVKDINSATSSVLIVGTSQFLSVFCQSVESVILEGENNKSFLTLQRPFVDMRKIVFFICKFLNTRLILADTLLSIESIWQTKEDFFGELSPLKFRYIQNSEVYIENLGKQETSKKIEIFTKLCKDIIKKESNGNIFVYVARKGLSPYIFCGDCGKNVICNSCKAPVSLYENKKDKEANFFVCGKCKTKRSALERCQNCDSWKLIPFGFGLETVLKEIENLTDKKIFILEKETVKTHKKAESLVLEFYKTSRSILIGTSMAIPYINQKIESCIFTGFDSLLSIPDFRMNEKIMKDIINLKDKTSEKFMILTRQPEFKILEYASKAYISDFYREEIKERQDFDYPPFSVFIKISLSGQKNSIRKKMEELQENLKPFDLFIFDGNYLNSKKEHTVNGLLKIHRKDWPNKELSNRIKSLSPEFTIKIDPDNIL